MILDEIFEIEKIKDNVLRVKVKENQPEEYMFENHGNDVRMYFLIEALNRFLTYDFFGKRMYLAKVEFKFMKNITKNDVVEVLFDIKKKRNIYVVEYISDYFQGKQFMLGVEE